MDSQYFSGLQGSGLAHSENVAETELWQNLVQEGQRGLHLLEHAGLLLVD